MHREGRKEGAKRSLAGLDDNKLGIESRIRSKSRLSIKCNKNDHP
jgi:hypothetical protein